MCYNAIKEVGSTLSNLKIIEVLSQLVEEQNEIIDLLSTALKEAGVTCEPAQGKILAARKKYTEILGMEEMPDNLS